MKDKPYIPARWEWSHKNQNWMLMEDGQVLGNLVCTADHHRKRILDALHETSPKNDKQL